MVLYRPGERLPPEHAALVQVLIPQQMDLALFRENSNHPDPRQVAIFANGTFPTEDPEKQVILSSWLEFHEKAYDSANPPRVEAFGLDVARSLDGDSTALAAGGEQGLRAVHKWKYADITYHVRETLRIARESYGIDLTHGRVPITVDMDGLGAGVGDRLRELNCWVIEFRGNAGSEVDPRTYGNLRTEGYATLGRRLNPDDRWKGIPWAMPVDEMLREELCAPEKMFAGGDALRFGLTPKNRPHDKPDVVSVKDKIGRSPDTADAVIYLFHAIRILLNWNSIFAQATRELIMWPAPAPPDPSRAPRPPEDQEDELTLANLPTPPPDQLAGLPPIVRFAFEAYGKGGKGAADLAGKKLPAASDSTTPPEQPAPAAPSWLEHVRWDE